MKDGQPLCVHKRIGIMSCMNCTSCLLPQECHRPQFGQALGVHLPPRLGASLGLIGAEIVRWTIRLVSQIPICIRNPCMQMRLAFNKRVIHLSSFSSWKYRRKTSITGQAPKRRKAFNRINKRNADPRTEIIDGCNRHDPSKSPVFAFRRQLRTPCHRSIKMSASQGLSFHIHRTLLVMPKAKPAILLWDQVCAD